MGSRIDCNAKFLVGSCILLIARFRNKYLVILPQQNRVTWFLVALAQVVPV